MVLRNVLLIDESKTLLKSCQASLDGQSHPISILDPRLAVNLLDRKEIQVVVLSSHGSDAESLGRLTAIKNRYPSSAFVLAASDPTPEFILSALRSGIDDVVHSASDPSDLLASICQSSHVSETVGPLMFNLYHMDSFPPSEVFERPSRHTRLPSTGLRTNSTDNPFHGLNLTVRKLFMRVRSFVHLAAHQTRAPVRSPQVTSSLGGASSYKQLVGPPPIRTDRKPATANSPSVSTAELKVHFFGRFYVEIGNKCVDTWSSHKAKLLFAYMLFNRHRSHCRDVLMDKFWPNAPPLKARNSLNVAIHAIRGHLHDAGAVYEYVLFKEECYYINPDVDVWVDVEQFIHQWHKTDSHQKPANPREIIQELEAARTLYSADFMEGDLYDEWVSVQRENLKEMYLATLDRLSEYYLLNNEASDAAQVCETILLKDDCREDVHRRLMLCYYLTGCRNKALRQFKKCQETLKMVLEIEPARITRQLYEDIRNDHVPPALLKP